jgi:hypothetical protein
MVDCLYFKLSKVAKVKTGVHAYAVDFSMVELVQGRKSEAHRGGGFAISPINQSIRASLRLLA